MKKKLIEVALPLDAINKESAREKSIRHGHPSTVHLWWARRPLAACRAVLFASLVDDPSSLPEQFPTEADQDRERQRLFRLIEELVKWDNANNPAILKAAHDEILNSTGGNPPPVYDPFCGGGSIPLEAQRLGLEAHGSDLNPVAVLITKALIEIPPKFAGHQRRRHEAESASAAPLPRFRQDRRNPPLPRRRPDRQFGGAAPRRTAGRQSDHHGGDRSRNPLGSAGQRGSDSDGELQDSEVRQSRFRGELSDWQACGVHESTEFS